MLLFRPTQQAFIHVLSMCVVKVKVERRQLELQAEYFIDRSTTNALVNVVGGRVGGVNEKSGEEIL